MKRVGNFRGFAVAFMMLLFTVSTSEAQQSDCRLWGRDLYKEGNYKQAIEFCSVANLLKKIQLLQNGSLHPGFIPEIS
ncbi:MAG: hypothetical protein IPI23_03745 [Bacteroidetes bacterium]|nr:hypothetical protein [Bacteroidota bacterium]